MPEKDFKRESVRATCVLWLKQAIERVNECGFKVVIASDEEGNNWNELNPVGMEYTNTRDKYIALGVFRSIDESDIFEEYDTKLCQGCTEPLLEGQSINRDRHSTCI